MVDTFYGDPCGAGADDLWAKRKGAWFILAQGKPIMPPCLMKSKGVPQDVIPQLLSHYAGSAYAAAARAQAQKDLKSCPH